VYSIASSNEILDIAHSCCDRNCIIVVLTGNECALYSLRLALSLSRTLSHSLQPNACVLYTCKWRDTAFACLFQMYWHFLGFSVAVAKVATEWIWIPVALEHEQRHNGVTAIHQCEHGKVGRSVWSKQLLCNNHNHRVQYTCGTYDCRCPETVPACVVWCSACMSCVH
jgi:hypothetical protein